MKITLIDTQDKLIELASNLISAQIISMDTEFVRRETYYAKLALIQIAFADNIYIIDVLMTDINILWDAILKSNAVKVIHSSRQDLEIFYYLFKNLPNNIFDTQIAASFCGYRSAMSYADLCKDICGIELDKTMQTSAWLERPLKPEMIAYAALDVEYLERIYIHLKSIIDKRKDSEEIIFQMRDMFLDLSIYKNLPEKAWTKIKFKDRSQNFINRMKVLAAFREESAMQLNIPRGFFITDDQLIEVAKRLPVNIQMLKATSRLEKYAMAPKYLSKLFDICSSLSE